MSDLPNRLYREPLPPRPDDEIATLTDFTRCLSPSQAIVDRHALEVVLAYLAGGGR